MRSNGETAAGRPSCGQPARAKPAGGRNGQRTEAAMGSRSGVVCVRELGSWRGDKVGVGVEDDAAMRRPAQTLSDAWVMMRKVERSNQRQGRPAARPQMAPGRARTRGS